MKDNALIEWLAAGWPTSGEPLRLSQLSRLIAQWQVHPRSVDSAKQVAYRLMASKYIVQADGVPGYVLSPSALALLPAKAPSKPKAPPAAVPAVPPAVVPAAESAAPADTSVPDSEDAALFAALREVTRLMAALKLKRITVEGGRMEYEKEVVVTRSFRL